MIVDERITHAGIDAKTFAGIRSCLQEAWTSGGMAAAVRQLPDWICDRLAVCGTPDDCRARLLEFAEAGVRTVVLFNVLGPDPAEAIRLVAGELIPAVTG
jgi:5,10-methylenetetrahydromethanopterin reductase